MSCGCVTFKYDTFVKNIMQPKTIKIIYWIVTILFCALMLYSGISQLILLPQGVEIMTHLGYPNYVSIILGVAKILGVVALLQPWFKTIKEWAYAGFAIDLVGATISFGAVDGVMAALSLIPFLIFFAIVYYVWKKKSILA